MVGCAHLGRAVRINKVDPEALSSPSPEKLHLQNDPKEDGIETKFSCWNCEACGSSESPWICLTCGLIHCGRYVNGDGLQHYEDNDEHALTMDCLNYKVFCYKCDEYVSGDTMDRKIFTLRTSLNARNSKHMEILCDEGTEEEDASKVDELLALTSNGTPEDESESVLEDNNPGRCLRSRKRKHSPSSETSKASHGDDRKWRGLRNLGNTCFMNAIVQALNSLDVFRDFMTCLPTLMFEKVGPAAPSTTAPRYRTRQYTQLNFPEGDGQSLMFAEEFRRTVVAMSSDTTTSSFSPEALFHSLWGVNDRFAGFSQQDCHEFLRYSLDQLHADLRRCRIPDDCAWKVANRCGAEYSPTSSAVSLMFEGALQSQVTCMSCDMTSNKQDPFLDLSLDIHIPPSTNARSVSANLMECIERFFMKEELEQCEQYMCGKCREKKPSTKQLFLRCLPKVLCLHLKRFRWSHCSRGKVDNMVDFPLRGLDMSHFVSDIANNRGKRCAYDLSSVVVHHGMGMGGGHYTAYCLRDGQWAHYNDSTVKLTDSETVLKQKAYILFYTRT